MDSEHEIYYLYNNVFINLNVSVKKYLKYLKFLIIIIF